MPGDNGRLHNIEQCIRDLNAKIDSKTDTILEKISTLAPAAQVVALEKRTRHLEVKQAGVAATMTAAGLWIKAHFFG